jgi:hypothetical protein
MMVAFLLTYSSMNMLIVIIVIDEEEQDGCVRGGQRADPPRAVEELSVGADHTGLRHIWQSQTGEVPRKG